MLNKKFALILPAILLILSISVLAIDVNWAPGVPDEGNGEEPPPSLIKTYDSTLQIKEINAKVDGKKDTMQNSGEKISKEAKQESNVEFEINVKNIFDKEIKNIAVTVIIEDIDDGDDLKEDADISKLAPGDSKKLDFDFNLPLKVDDKGYNVKINLRGKDQDNNIHKLDWTLILEVKKDKHNVKITKASISPSIVSCSRVTNAIVEILNLGSEEEDVKLEITNKELGIDIKEKDIELDTGTHDDAEYEKTFTLNIPSNIKAGAYPIPINVYYNKDKSLITKKVDLVIEDCTQIKQSGVSIKSLPPTASETLGKLKTKAPEKTIISIASDESIILLLTITLIIILGLIIFLLGAIIIQLRR